MKIIQCGAGPGIARQIPTNQYKKFAGGLPPRPKGPSPRSNIIPPLPKIPNIQAVNDLQGLPRALPIPNATLIGKSNPEKLEIIKSHLSKFKGMDKVDVQKYLNDIDLDLPPDYSSMGKSKYLSDVARDIVALNNDIDFRDYLGIHRMAQPEVARFFKRWKFGLDFETDVMRHRQTQKDFFVKGIRNDVEKIRTARLLNQTSPEISKARMAEIETISPELAEYMNKIMKIYNEPLVGKNPLNLFLSRKKRVAKKTSKEPELPTRDVVARFMPFSVIEHLELAPDVEDFGVGEFDYGLATDEEIMERLETLILAVDNEDITLNELLVYLKEAIRQSKEVGVEVTPEFHEMATNLQGTINPSEDEGQINWGFYLTIGAVAMIILFFIMLVMFK